MRDKVKKTLAATLATICLGAMFVGCGEETMQYSGDTPDQYVSAAPVSSNGGFAVVKGDFVYFINGKESEEATNEYGDVVKGALMRISKADLDAGNYANVKTIVPSVLAAKDYTAGIFIYGDYVYYATPTTDETDKGEAVTSYIDFKRAKLDGSEGPMNDYFLRLSDNTTKYRFVEENGVVYCLYEQDGALKSLNTSTKTTTVLVKSASSSFYFDTEDLTNPNVYYTMSVTPEGGSAQQYNQVYRVNAAATASTNGSNAQYTVKDENGNAVKTYSFNKADMDEANEEAKENKQDPVYDLDDYSTYTYVNLGELVLDGVGSDTTLNVPTQYNWESDRSKCETDEGYSYTLSDNCYQGGTLYFTRTKLGRTTSSPNATPYALYYLSDATVEETAWNVLSGNATVSNSVASTNSAATTSAAMFYSKEGIEYTLHVSSGTLYREGYDNVTKQKTEETILATNVGTITFTKLDEEKGQVYFTKENGNGWSLSRLQYDGDKDAYSPLVIEDEYKIVSLKYLVCSNDWYKPELIGDTVLYANAQSFGGSTYEYIYAAKMGSVDEINAANEKYDEVQKFITKSTHQSDLQTAMQYYYRTGETAIFDEFRDSTQYSQSEKDAFDKFVAMFADGKEFEGMHETDLTAQVGKTKQDDLDAMEEGWRVTLQEYEDEEEEEESAALPTWAIVLIVIGAIAVIVAAYIVVAIYDKKKKLRKLEEAATVNAYKRKKIDTTDDKSIDVYADEDDETVDETVDEELKETLVDVDETVDETVDESAETETVETPNAEE